MKSRFHQFALLAVSAALLLSVSCRREESRPLASGQEQQQEEEPIAFYKDSRCKGQEKGPFQVVRIYEELPTPKRKFRPEVVCLSKDRGEQVIWVAAGNSDLEIEFPAETPFEEGGQSGKRYSVARGSSVRSGPIRGGVGAGTEFSYDVRIPGGPVVDPRVVIED